MILKGIFGKTVVSYQAGTIQYMDVADAIVQRHVDVSDIYLFEQMGISFGREPVKSNPSFEKVSGRPTRPY
jgi:6-phosphofructokinase 1